MDSGLPTRDRDLLELAALPRLKYLDISKARTIIIADCRKLAKLTSLETLYVDSSPISNSGFKVRTSFSLLHCS